MICLTCLVILLIIMIFLSIIAIFAFSMGGTLFMIIFGDVIVCIVFLAWLIRCICKKKKNKRNKKK